MKKILFLLFVCAATGCTQSKFGRGGSNACQFVREQVPGLRDDIASVEVIDVDSLLTDCFLDLGSTILYKAEVDYYEKHISRQQLDSIIDEVSRELTDIEESWTIGIVVNDSLKHLEKYSHMWRKVYKVEVTMKSGIKKFPRVMMDQDGVTPYCLEKDVEKSVREHVNTMTDVIRNIMY